MSRRTPPPPAAARMTGCASESRGAKRRHVCAVTTCEMTGEEQLRHAAQWGSSPQVLKVSTLVLAFQLPHVAACSYEEGAEGSFGAGAAQLQGKTK